MFHGRVKQVWRESDLSQMIAAGEDSKGIHETIWAR